MKKSYLKYNKNQLINLNYSLSKEMLRASRNGAYSSSTIISCNTRKYHGLLVAPQENIDQERHVLLSTVDEALIINNAEFNLSSRIFPGGVIFPKGHKYISDFNSDPNLQLSYSIGKTIFNKEYIFVANENRLLLKYTLEDTAADNVVFRLSPFLAFRNIHSLSKANLFVNNRFNAELNGASWQMYEGYSRLYFQSSKEVEYVHSPEWHYNIEYPKERERGYEYLEDLFVPGFFELKLEKGESVVFSVGLEPKNPQGFAATFGKEVKKRIIRESYEKCLQNAADQFIIKSKSKTSVISGYHWFGFWGRDTFISLPGLTLTMDNEKEFHDVMKTMIKTIQNGNFVNTYMEGQAVYNAIDTPFWFFRALHKFAVMTGKVDLVWKEYGKVISGILQTFRNAQNPMISLHDNGLIWSGEKDKATSWMDAEVNGIPVIPRYGYLVEINAIWYDSIKFFVDLAEMHADTKFVKTLAGLPAKIEKSFTEIFWDKKKAILADFVDEGGANWDVRPNAVFAISEKYSPLKEDQKEYVLKSLIDELLTPRGLRTLTPKDIDYKGTCIGNYDQRSRAYYQGSACPWLLGPFAEAYLKMHPKTGKAFVTKIYLGFEDEMVQNGLGTISEIYDGNPPFSGRGAISMARNVAEILRIKWMIDNREKLDQ